MKSSPKWEWKEYRLGMRKKKHSLACRNMLELLDSNQGRQSKISWIHNKEANQAPINSCQGRKSKINSGMKSVLEGSRFKI